jgi:NRAMP (natural resistance-associated macrophage protein)-like metal ion transporter
MAAPHVTSLDPLPHHYRLHRKLATKAKRGVLACLGPGLITGASDDDPSGIATYSQTGAQYGYSMLWTMVLTLPLMAAIQEIAARIGRVTGRGLARNMRLHYSAWIVYPVVLLLLIANIINLGADIGAMGAAVYVVTGGPDWLPLVYALVLTALSLVAQIYLSYDRYTRVLKYLTAAMLVYVITVFVVHISWGEALQAMVVPRLQWSDAYIGLLVGVLGTTISPYLFFWQASLESEHVKVSPGTEPLRKAPEQSREALSRIRIDTYLGMAFSNIISLSIILCAAATLHASPDPKMHDISSASQAAEALRPLAGNFASTLFAIGILSGGLLAIPSLAGSAAYSVGELFRWPVGLEHKPHKAKGFYAALTIATLLAVVIVLSPINPIRALVWAAVINGITAVPIMVMIMLLFSNAATMGSFALTGKWLRIGGWLATGVMGLAAMAYFWTLMR